MMHSIHISCILIGLISCSYSNVINHNSDGPLTNNDNLIGNNVNVNKNVLDKTKLSNDNENDNVVLTLEDQVQLMSKQLNALMTRRREDYKMLENSLKKYVRKNSLQFLDKDIKNELDQLRQDMKTVNEGATGNKERLTVQWLSQSITELRKELAEVQESTSSTSKDIQRRNLIMEDINTIKNDLNTIKLEITSLKSRQERTDILVRELREEAVQSAEDIKKSFKQQNQAGHIPQTIDFIEPEADHRMRHQRFLRQEIHEVEVAQSGMRRELDELINHRMADRIRSLEIEQRRMANYNFNMSRQISNLDKLHVSMLELLEAVQEIQTKVDKTIPDFNNEISKLEFNSAQLISDQNLLREEGQNSAKSIQAMAVSISTLQGEREQLKQYTDRIKELEKDVEQIKSLPYLNNDIARKHIDKIESASRINMSQLSAGESNEMAVAEELIEKLENVELEYESIVNKLPHDCSQINMNSLEDSPNEKDETNGLYLIAPVGQHHPIMTRCSGNWTTIQRRQDGSVDFNRTWAEYADGFGTPSGEFWIGNEALHHLTNGNCTKLRIRMQDIYDNTWYADYNEFRIDSRKNGYRLSISGYMGNASDALDYQNHMEFSAIDIDRDISNTHCAGNYEGGWWFSHCQHANLNGRYNLGLTWFDSSRNEWIAVKSSHMMISQRADCHKPNMNENNLSIKASTTTSTTSHVPSISPIF